GLGALLAVACLVAAAVAAAAVLRRRERSDRRLAAVAYLGVVPLGGLVATFAALITHQYYFWPVLVLPFALAPLALPRGVLAESAVVLAGALVVLGVATGGVANLAAAGGYFGYRNAETRCLDAAVGPALGYATFSDARRLS